MIASASAKEALVASVVEEGSTRRSCQPVVRWAGTPSWNGRPPSPRNSASIPNSPPMAGLVVEGPLQLGLAHPRAAGHPALPGFGVEALLGGTLVPCRALLARLRGLALPLLGFGAAERCLLLGRALVARGA